MNDIAGRRQCGVRTILIAHKKDGEQEERSDLRWRLTDGMQKQVESSGKRTVSDRLRHRLTFLHKEALKAGQRVSHEYHYLVSQAEAERTVCGLA